MRYHVTGYTVLMEHPWKIRILNFWRWKWRTSFETVVTTYRVMQRHIPGDKNPQLDSCENLRTHTMILIAKLSWSNVQGSLHNGVKWKCMLKFGPSWMEDAFSRHRRIHWPSELMMASSGAVFFMRIWADGNSVCSRCVNAPIRSYSRPR